MTGYAAAKTKPIPGVEIASPAFAGAGLAFGLLAMTDGRQGPITLTPRLGAAGQACKTKPIWTDGRKREVFYGKRVTSSTGDPMAIQNKANPAHTRAGFQRGDLCLGARGILIIMRTTVPACEGPMYGVDG